ncbi:MAG TPA: FAD-dependent monooxygenase, partial [bacterium]|nr:FAD-dependent monooxygenase [bacterium]
HSALILHTPRRRATWPLPEPFCTFDYRRFCLLAYAGTEAEFRQTAVLGRAPRGVLTAAGEIPARLLVDATGWRAVLAGDPARRRGEARMMAFGIETEIATPFEAGLHFYFLPEVRDGYAWAFPCGGTVRFGVLSYLGRTRLADALGAFLARFGLRPAAIHGGFLASGLRPPVADGVFLAGDAAGHCLPLSGEGIRTAVRAGFKVGELLRQVLDGQATLAQAQAAYAAFSARARRPFRALTAGNVALLLMPLGLTAAAAAVLSRPWMLDRFMRHYLAVFADARPGPSAFAAAPR